MIKRPLNPRFSQAVFEERKFTTIRRKAWPVGVPIMLYNWSGKPYRSKHRDVAAVVVSGFWTIKISHQPCGTMRYVYGMECQKELYEAEGFDSREAMDEWFRSAIKPGETVNKVLMRFRLYNAPVEGREGGQPESNNRR